MKNCKYTIEEKKALPAKVKESKEKYNDEVEAMKEKFHWDAKRNDNDKKALNAAIKMAKICYDKAEDGQLDNIVENPKKTVPCCRRWWQNKSNRPSRCFVRMICRCTDIFKCTITT